MKRCVACGEEFKPWPQIRNQQYCSNPNCQRERRRRKQAHKRANNSDLRNSNAQYFKDWAAKNPGYWKKYRNDHPAYEKNNRDQQRLRNMARIAKDDVKPPLSLPPGRYQLIPIGPQTIANEVVWIVEIIVLSGP